MNQEVGPHLTLDLDLEHPAFLRHPVGGHFVSPNGLKQMLLVAVSACGLWGRAKLISTGPGTDVVAGAWEFCYSEEVCSNLEGSH